MQSLRKPVSTIHQYDTTKCYRLQKSPIIKEADWGGKSGEDDDALFTHTGTFIELVKAISIKDLRAKTLGYVIRYAAKVKMIEAGSRMM